MIDFFSVTDIAATKADGEALNARFDLQLHSADPDAVWNYELGINCK